MIEHDTSINNNFWFFFFKFYLNLDCEYLISSHLLSEIGNEITESNIYDNRTVILPYLFEACEEGLFNI